MTTQTKKWIALRYDGSTSTHATLDAARRAAKRSSGPQTVVEIRAAGETVPPPNDAEGWDRYRMQAGISGCHH